MKMSLRSRSQNPGPISGLIFGLLFSAIGIGLWYYTMSARDVSPIDDVLAVGTLIIGLCSAAYAARELRRPHP
jgi:hypothetical protein